MEDANKSSEILIQKLKNKASDFAKKHATESAKYFYILGKQDAAKIFLSMIKSDGYQSAIQDVAKELLKVDPNCEQAIWIVENFK